jgi:hypothetical protein
VAVAVDFIKLLAQKLTVQQVVLAVAELTQFKALVLVALEPQGKEMQVAQLAQLKTLLAVVAVPVLSVAQAHLELAELQVMAHNGTQILLLHIMVGAELVCLAAQQELRAVLHLALMVLPILALAAVLKTM